MVTIKKYEIEMLFIMVSIMGIRDCSFLQRILQIKKKMIVETETKIKNF